MLSPWRLAVWIIGGWLMAMCPPASAAIGIDYHAAEATLAAMGNPDLTAPEAERVARLPGNQGLVRKLVELGSAATTEGFAKALMAMSHGEVPDRTYGLDLSPAKRAATMALIRQIKSNPADFQDWISDRVRAFTPAGIDVDATGYLIVGGKADGFSFDKPEFYLNISVFGDDFGGARIVMAHELYHAIQNAMVSARPGLVFDFNIDRYSRLKSDAERTCYAQSAIAGSILAEGSATLVGDPVLLPADGIYSRSTRERYVLKPDLIGRTTLLDMSLRSVTMPGGVAPELVYAVGFYNRAPLYDLGYVMAKTIASSDGNAGLGRLVALGPKAFFTRYIEIADLDTTNTLPRLGSVAKVWTELPDCR